MKNEKFCFSKGTGLIALVGVVLVALALLMGSLPNQTTSTSTKAFLGCPDSSFPRSTCADDKTARDGNGDVMTKDGKTCCYLATAYKTHCPSGSTPDPLEVCATRKVFGKVIGEIVYDGVGTMPENRRMAVTSKDIPVQCCNWYNEVDALPTIRPESPIVQEPDYCSTIGQTAGVKLYPIAKVSDAGATSPTLVYPRWVNDALRFNKCVTPDGKPTQKPQWDGAWGKDAKCYEATGVCSKVENCNNIDCLAGQSATIKCLNRPVEMQKCIDAGTAPKYVVNRSAMQCPPLDKNGKIPMVYLNNGAGVYYLQDGEARLTTFKVTDPTSGRLIKEVDKAPFCVNERLNGVPAGVTVPKTPDCITGNVAFGWGEAANSSVSRSCYLKNGGILAGTNACNAWKLVPEEFCQCYSDFRATKDNTTLETCVYVKQIWPVR